MRSRIVSDTERSAAQRVIDRLHVESQHEGTVPSRFLDVLAHAVREEVWRERGQSFKEFLEADYPNGIEIREGELAKILKLKHKHEDKSAEKAAEMKAMRGDVERLLDEAEPLQPHRGTIGRGRVRSDNITPTARGTDSTYALRRLKRDRPDLAEKVMNKELSANAAAIEAGFRDRTFTVSEDVHKAARTLQKHFDPDELYKAMTEARNG